MLVLVSWELLDHILILSPSPQTSPLLRSLLHSELCTENNEDNNMNECLIDYYFTSFVLQWAISITALQRVMV